MACSVIAPATAGDGDEALMKQRLQFSASLKDLKNLRKQLYSAAEYFESSYMRDNHKQFVVESSKEYVGKALVNTVDHLGSVADKLNKFMDQNANQLSTTSTHFSCIQQRLCRVTGLVESGCLSQHLFHAKDIANLKHTILPGRMKADPPLTRKHMSTREALSFSFTKMTPSKEAGRRSVSPLGLRFNMSSKRSVSPNPSFNKVQRPTEPRRAISASRGREMRSAEMEMESYTKKSKHLLKALLSLHHSRNRHRDT